MDEVKKEIVLPSSVDEKKKYSTRQSFNGIGVLQAISGAVILRGRNGTRDHIFTVDQAIKKYQHTKDKILKWSMYDIERGTELTEINDCLKAKIKEAILQLKGMGYTPSKEALQFELKG